MRRIGYLTYGLDRAPTGIGRYAIELVRALATLPDAPEIVLLTTEREDRHGLWSAFERHALPGCQRLPALLSLGNWQLSRAARRYDLELIHDPNGIAPFLGPSGGARRIVTIHDAFAYVYPATHNRLDNWRYRWLLPRAARAAARVLTDSEHSRRDLQRHLGLSDAAIEVVHCGLGRDFRPIDRAAARAAVLQRYGISGPYLLYVGGINARKNIARLFEAYARVREQHPAIRLVIGGKRQWQVGEIDATFERLAMHKHVLFTGYVPDVDLPALYSAASAFVFPSLYEGFGLPPLEAMACGAPVITSNVSSLPEVVGDAALQIDPTDVAALAAAISRVLDQPALADELRARGRARSQRFTWTRAAQQTLAIYQDVVARSIAPGAAEAVAHE
jgi:glycosyltransferase involved in cell wall biosynthesis